MQSITHGCPDEVLKYPKHRRPEDNEDEEDDEVFIGFHRRNLEVKVICQGNLFAIPLNCDILSVELNLTRTVAFIACAFHIYLDRVGFFFYFGHNWT